MPNKINTRVYVGDIILTKRSSCQKVYPAHARIIRRNESIWNWMNHRTHCKESKRYYIINKPFSNQSTFSENFYSIKFLLDQNFQFFILFVFFFISLLFFFISNLNFFLIISSLILLKLFIIFWIKYQFIDLIYFSNSINPCKNKQKCCITKNHII